jgi:hypothetical protein
VTVEQSQISNSDLLREPCLEEQPHEPIQPCQLRFDF